MLIVASEQSVEGASLVLFGTVLGGVGAALSWLMTEAYRGREAYSRFIQSLLEYRLSFQQLCDLMDDSLGQKISESLIGEFSSSYSRFCEVYSAFSLLPGWRRWCSGGLFSDVSALYVQEITKLRIGNDFLAPSARFVVWNVRIVALVRLSTTGTVRKELDRSGRLEPGVILRDFRPPSFIEANKEVGFSQGENCCPPGLYT